MSRAKVALVVGVFVCTFVASWLGGDSILRTWGWAALFLGVLYTLFWLVVRHNGARQETESSKHIEHSV